jgi:hypothetical protein
MIAETRAYIKAQIEKCKPDYKEIRDPLGTDDISLSLIDQNYKIIFGEDATEYIGNFVSESIPVTLEIYKKAGYDEIADFDNTYDLARQIRSTIIDPLEVKNQTSFTDITPTGITPEALDTNDKVYRFLLTFNIRKDFDFQGV